MVAPAPPWITSTGDAGRATGDAPPTLVTAGERDETAVPSHAYKFIAALQRAQGCANPALLQVLWGAGHTLGTTREQSAEALATQLAFLDMALGEKPVR